MRSSHFGQVLQRRFLLEAHADNATMISIPASPIFNLTVIDSQLYCEYKGYHVRQLAPHHIAAHRNHRVGPLGNSTPCADDFPGRKGLSLVITRLVCGNNTLHFPYQIKPFQSLRMAGTRHLVEPLLLSSLAICFALGAIPH
jgi:hypothetical protein